MCYFLYGAVNTEADPKAWERASAQSEFIFRRGTKEDILKTAALGDQEFRVTDRYCDCGTPVGMKDPEADDLREIARQWKRLRQIPGVKCVWFSKSWACDGIAEEQTVHIDDIDPQEFLANVSKNCLNRIELYKRYW